MKAAEECIERVVERYSTQEKMLIMAYQEACAKLEQKRREEINQYQYVIDKLWLRFGTQIRDAIQADLATSRKKSINLDGAQIGYRKSAGKLVVQDEEAVKEWAIMHCPEAIKAELMRKPLSKYYDDHKEDGEIIPGTVYKEGQEEFYLRLGEQNLKLQTTEDDDVPTGEPDNPDPEQGSGG